MKKFKENKILYVLLFIILICVILIGVSLVKYFYFGSGTNKYGTRLNGIEEHKISKTIEEDLNKIYVEDKNVNNVKYDLQGKIIYLTVDFKVAVKLSVAQTTAVKCLEVFNEEDLSFYDVQFILTAESLEEKSDIFPTMGYKNSTSDSVVWVRG